MDEEVGGRRKQTVTMGKGQQGQRASVREKMKNRTKYATLFLRGEELQPPWCRGLQTDRLMIKRLENPQLALHTQSSAACCTVTVCLTYLSTLSASESTPTFWKIFRRRLSASMVLSPSLKEITSSLPFLHPKTAALSSVFRYLLLNFCKPLAFLVLGCFARPSPLSSPLHLSPFLHPLLRAGHHFHLSLTLDKASLLSFLAAVSTATSSAAG